MNNILFKVLLLKGENGNSIASIAKTSTSGLVDTYTVTLTDGSTTEFTVTNGKGIVGIAKTGTSGLVDTYTITFNDNTTATFTVTNGANGRGIASIVKTGTSGLVDTYTITYTDNTTSTFTVTNGEDGTGDLTTDTETGNPIALTTDTFQPARQTKITLAPIQASGTPTPSNPLPISGYDEVSLDVVPKNMLDVDKYYGTYKQADGTYLATALQLSNLPIPLANFIGTELTFSCKITANANTTSMRVVANINGTDKNGSYVNSGTTGVSSVTFTPATINDTIYISYGSGGNNQSTFSEFQLELGSTATAYSPYTPATQITHSFPTTIYGGEVDVERGVLKVTHGEVDLGVLDWGYISGDHSRFTTALTGYKPSTSSSVLPFAKCSCYQATSMDQIYQHQVSLAFSIQTNPNQSDGLWVYDSNYTDPDLFKTAVTGQKLVYELATPTEIQLTPRIVNLLQGANVITTNGTSIEITYRNGTIATLADVGNLNRTIDALATETAGNKVDIATNASDIDTLDGKAVKQTSGVLDAKVNANVTAMATLTTAQLRDIVISDTAPTIGGTSPYPDGTLMLVYS